MTGPYSGELLRQLLLDIRRERVLVGVEECAERSGVVLGVFEQSVRRSVRELMQWEVSRQGHVGVVRVVIETNQEVLSELLAAPLAGRRGEVTLVLVAEWELARLGELTSKCEVIWLG